MKEQFLLEKLTLLEELYSLWIFLELIWDFHYNWLRVAYLLEKSQALLKQKLWGENDHNQDILLIGEPICTVSEFVSNSRLHFPDGIVWEICFGKQWAILGKKKKAKLGTWALKFHYYDCRIKFDIFLFQIVKKK